MEKGGMYAFDIEDGIDGFDDVWNGVSVDVFIGMCWHLHLHWRAFALACIGVCWHCVQEWKNRE